MLDTANLDAIAQETRACFLYEDVPDYIAALERDTRQLFGDPELTVESLKAVYTDLMRTAHSLKGGAGIAELPRLSRLAHQLEDLVEALSQGRVADIQPAHALLSSGIEQIGLLVNAAMRDGAAGEAEVAATLLIYDELDDFLRAVPAQTEADAMAEMSSTAPNPFVVKSALTVDLEECLQRVEAQLARVGSPAQSSEIISAFADECVMLSQVLSQSWLAELVGELKAIAATAPPELPELAIATFAAIREQRDLVLVDMGASPFVVAPVEPATDLSAAADSTEALALSEAIASEVSSTPDFLDELGGDDAIAELAGLSSESDSFDVFAALDLDPNDPSFLDDLPDTATAPAGDDLAFLDDLDPATESPKPVDPGVAAPLDLSDLDATSKPLASLDDLLGEADLPDDVAALMGEAEIASEMSSDFEGAIAAELMAADDTALSDADALAALGIAEIAPVDDLETSSAATELAPEMASPDVELITASLSNGEAIASLPTNTAEVESVSQSTPQAIAPSAPRPSLMSGVAIPTSQQSASSSQVAQPDLKLRMSVSRLDRIDNTLGELLIVRERLLEHHRQLELASRSLKQRSQQLVPINDRVRTFYDRLATEQRPAESIDPQQHSTELDSISLTDAIDVEPAPSDTEFDALEFDRYTDFHSTLQDLQELMVQVQENRSDIDVISRAFQDALDDLRDQMDSLRGDLRDSRFVPFRALSDQFVQPLRSLNQDHGKSVELVVDGSETPIDQAVVEQLQAPLKHLFRNAFDHGIETAEERQAAGKSSAARITLSASIQGNQIAIAIQDDGRGIDLDKVTDKAIRKGLCEADRRDRLTPAEIYEFLFTAGFSTADAVSSLSGRGVGLDIVRLQVERLHGTIRVNSTPGQGTTFILSMPLSLNIAPLLVCRCQQHTLSLLSSSILAVVATDELERQGDRLIWQDRPVSAYPLMQLLPYADSTPVPNNPPLMLMVDVAGQTVGLGIDGLIAERELVIKSFDATVAVPDYLGGCTVLGSGEVIPVIAPSGLQELLSADGDRAPKTPTADPAEEATELTVMIVDDSIAVRRMLDRLLTRMGYRVVQCRDGKEALEMLDRADEQFHAAISDIEMPRLDGFGLLREIRGRDRWHDLPVAMLTSRDNDLHRSKASDLGATAYFTKPFQPNDLLAKVAEMVASAL
ncbi:MAG: response regulator [Cyanobacteria bacterium J06639_1]